MPMGVDTKKKKKKAQQQQKPALPSQRYSLAKDKTFR